MSRVPAMKQSIHLLNNLSHNSALKWRNTKIIQDKKNQNLCTVRIENKEQNILKNF